MPETPEPDYLEPLRRDLAWNDDRIKELETELIARRAKRTALGRALASLDPTYEARTKKTSPKQSGPSFSPERQAEILALLRERFSADGQTFRASEVAEASGVHETTIHKILKTFHESGALVLDHMGGQRKSTKYYRVVGDAPS